MVKICYFLTTKTQIGYLVIVLLRRVVRESEYMQFSYFQARINSGDINADDRKVKKLIKEDLDFRESLCNLDIGKKIQELGYYNA